MNYHLKKSVLAVSLAFSLFHGLAYGSDMTIDSGQVVDFDSDYINDDSSTIEINGTLNNNETLTNSGTINNNSIITNNGHLDNVGALNSIGGFVNNNGEIKISTGNGYFNFEGSAVLNNSGSINLFDNGYIYFSESSVSNAGSFSVDAANASFNNVNFSNSGNLSIEGIDTSRVEFADGTFVNEASGRINNNGTMRFTGTEVYNDGIIENTAINTNATLYFEVGSGASFVNRQNGQFLNSGKAGTMSGSFINQGALTNLTSDAGFINFSGEMINQSTGSFLNKGKVSNYYGNFLNEGIITNESIFDNQGSTFENNGVFTNSGSFDNTQSSIINNNSVFTNSGSFNNTQSSVINNNGVFTNSGNFKNDMDSTVQNTGLFANTESGILELVYDWGNELFQNNGTITNKGLITGTDNLIMGSSNSALIFEEGGRIDIPEVRLTGGSATLGYDGIADDFTITDLSFYEGFTNLNIAVNGNVVQSFSDTLQKGLGGGDGSLTKTGSGVLILESSDHDYTGGTNVNDGTLVIGQTLGSTNSLTSDVTINTGGALGGYGAINGTVHNAGMLKVGSVVAEQLVGSPSNYGTFTINGNYVGDNGQVELNGVIQSEADTLIDKLIINGNATGSTYVKINNIGGLGASALEGIEIIDVSGYSSANAFTQTGRIVAGAYEYSVVKGNTSETDTESWFLTSKLTETDPSNPDDSAMRPEVGSYLANLSAANNMFTTQLHERLGEVQFMNALTSYEHVNTLWGRYDVAHDRFKDSSGQVNSSSDHNILQVGGDVARWDNSKNVRAHLGLMGGYGRTMSDAHSKTGFYSKSKVEGYSVGVYSTLFVNNNENTSGLYVDGWLLWNDYNASVTGEQQKKEQYNIKGLTASIESGYALKTGQLSDYVVWIRPSAQLTWMNVDADNHVESNGTRVTGDGQNFQTRLGVRTYLSNDAPDNDKAWQPFIEANWIRNNAPFLVNMNDEDIKLDGVKNIGEIRVGMEGKFNKNSSIWMNIGYQAGQNHYESIRGTLGVKYSF